MDGKVIYVYVKENSNSVSCEDIVQWLGFLDEIEDAKVQLDVKENDVCYYVKFKHAAAAQLAISNLDGEKLKNCLIRIKGAVPPLSSQQQDDTIAKKEVQTRDPSALLFQKSSNLLPFNEVMPKELKMSDFLVNYIKAVEEDSSFSEGKTIFKTLKVLQEEWWRMRKEIENHQLQLHNINNSIKENTAVPQVIDASPSTIVNTKFPVSFSITTPHLLLTAISYSVGPIEQYCVVQIGGSFLLSLSLMMIEDVDVFFSLCAQAPTSNNSTKSQLVCSVEWYKSEDTSWVAKPQNIDLELIKQFS